KSNLVEVPGIAIDDLVKQADKFDAVVLTQDIAILEELRRTMRYSIASRAILDAALVRLALAEQFSSVEELLGRVNGGGAAPAQKKKLEVATRAEGGRQRAEKEVVAVPSDPIQPSDEDDALPQPGRVWEN